MVLLRNFQVTDLDEISLLEERAFPEAPYEKELLAKVFTSERSINEIAVVENRIAGYVVALVMNDKAADIESIAVDPDLSGMGIGSTLLETIEEKLWIIGIRRIVLEVRDTKTEAIEFYKKHGYKVMEHLKNYYTERYRGSRNAYRMFKILN